MNGLWLYSSFGSESYVLLPTYISSKEIQVVCSPLMFTDTHKKSFPFYSYWKTEQKINDLCN